MKEAIPPAEKRVPPPIPQNGGVSASRIVLFGEGGREGAENQFPRRGWGVVVGWVGGGPLCFLVDGGRRCDRGRAAASPRASAWDGWRCGGGRGGGRIVGSGPVPVSSRRWPTFFLEYYRQPAQLPWGFMENAFSKKFVVGEDFPPTCGSPQIE